jgi:hypothetical protein
MSEKSLTAPLAIVKHNGVSIGKMRNVRVQESFQRGDVKGIGRITPQEKPVIGWSGTLSCEFILVDFDVSTIPNVLNRKVNSVTEFVNALIVSEIPVQVNLYKKIPDPDNILGTIEQPFATINDLLLESDGFSVNEGQVGGKSQSFSYLTPIIFPQ